MSVGNASSTDSLILDPSDCFHQLHPLTSYPSFFVTNDTPTLDSWMLRCLQPQSASPVRNLATRPRRAVSETTFDGTLIPETSFETLRTEDSLAKRVDAFGAEKPTIVTPGRAFCRGPKGVEGHHSSVGCSDLKVVGK